MLAVNAVGASASAVFAIVGAFRPAYVRPGSTVSPLTQFWALSSAARTWAVTGPLLWGIAQGRPPVELLRTAGIVQLLDAALGWQQRNPQMTALPAAMGVVHVVSASLLSAPAVG